MIMHPYDVRCNKWNSLIHFLATQWNVTPAMAEGQMKQMKFVCLSRNDEEIWVTFAPEDENTVIILRWVGGTAFTAPEAHRKTMYWKMTACQIP